MEDDKKNQLVRRPGSELGTPGRRTNRVMEGMTRDILARAKAQGLSAARFRIGDYLLREPDYRQIMRWAEAGGMRPEEVLERLAGSVVELPRSEPGIEPIRFSMEDGAMLSVAWDFERFPFTPDSWESGLLIRELGFESTRSNATIILRPNLPMLKTLVCESPRLKVLDLSQVPGLTELICEANDYTELDLTPVPGLTRLNCLVGKLDLTPVPGLSELNCGDSGLRELDLSPVPRLTRLNCESNGLTELDLTSVPGLTELYCLDNNLTELDLMPVPELTHLYCQFNNLTELVLTPVSCLTELECWYNSLTELDLTPVPGLSELDCSDNNLTELDLSPVPALTDLICNKELRLRNAPAGLNIIYL
jgi:hypothetical protein